MESTAHVNALHGQLLTHVGPAGETFAATSAEYFSLKQQLESECFAPEAPGEAPRYYSQLPQEQRARLLKERLKKYCQRVRALWLPKRCHNSTTVQVCHHK